MGEGMTPLMYAVQNGSITGTGLLLKARAQVESKDEDGLRPLHFAAASGAIEVCQVLLQFGADANALDEEGRRPLDHVPEALLYNKAEIRRWEAVLGTPDEPPKKPPDETPKELPDETPNEPPDALPDAGPADVANLIYANTPIACG